jgi:hypothetical protein
MTGAICRPKRSQATKMGAFGWRVVGGKGMRGVAGEAHTAEMQTVWKEEDGNIEGTKDAIATRSLQ